MTILPFSIDYLQDVYGITCVENQLSAIFKHLGLPLQAVYLNSYISLSNTLDAFIKKQTTYAYFDGIERLHETANKLGIARFTLSVVSFAQMIEELEISLSKGYPLLVEVDPGKLPKTGDIMPWRNDHFISLYGFEDEIIHALDDVPLRVLKLSNQELLDAYQNQILVFNGLNAFDKILYLSKAEAQIKKIAEFGQSKEETIWIDERVPGDIEDIVPLRDGIGVIRISRCRMKAWFKWLEEDYNWSFDKKLFTEFDSLINKLDRLFSAVEFSRLRKRINKDVLKKLLIEVVESDNRCLEYITLEIRH